MWYAPRGYISLLLALSLVGCGGELPASQPSNGQLAVSVSGLSSAAAQVSVSGPQGYQANLQGNTLLQKLLPGQYQIRGHTVHSQGSSETRTYTARAQAVEVLAEHTASVTLRYHLVARQQALWVLRSSGLGGISVFPLPLAGQGRRSSLWIPDLPERDLAALAVSPSGQLWVASSRGNIRLWGSSGPRGLTLAVSGAAPGISALAFSPSGELWVATLGGQLLGFTSQQLASGGPQPAATAVGVAGARGAVTALAATTSGGLWVGTAEGAFLLDASQLALGGLQRALISHSGPVLSLALSGAAGHQTLWVSGQTGLLGFPGGALANADREKPLRRKSPIPGRIQALLGTRQQLYAAGRALRGETAASLWDPGHPSWRIVSLARRRHQLIALVQESSEQDEVVALYPQPSGAWRAQLLGWPPARLLGSDRAGRLWTSAGGRSLFGFTAADLQGPDPRPSRRVRLPLRPIGFTFGAGRLALWNHSGLVLSLRARGLGSSAQGKQVLRAPGSPVMGGTWLGRDLALLTPDRLELLSGESKAKTLLRSGGRTTFLSLSRGRGLFWILAQRRRRALLQVNSGGKVMGSFPLPRGLRRSDQVAASLGGLWLGSQGGPAAEIGFPQAGRPLRVLQELSLLDLSALDVGPLPPRNQASLRADAALASRTPLTPAAKAWLQQRL